MSWEPIVNRRRGGHHRVIVTPPGGAPVDVTFFRHTETQVGPYSESDPFSDATAQIQFPQVSVLDDFTTPELSWLREDSNVDIWWVPGEDKPDFWTEIHSAFPGDTGQWINPMTDKTDSWAPRFNYVAVTIVGPDGITYYPDRLARRGTCVWQGYISSLAYDQDDKTSGVTATCQGALFQIDATMAKPGFPPRPQTLESVIKDQFDHDTNPTLRTQPCIIDWPTDWSYVAPLIKLDRSENRYGVQIDDPKGSGLSNLLDPDVKPGAKWTGYTTRDTGSWSHRLTDAIQSWLQVMLVKPGSGVMVGAQWTLRMRRAGHPLDKSGRRPVLMVRDLNTPESFTLWAGQVGVKLNITRDATQGANIVYGTGTDEGGVAWANSTISSDGRRTAYLPLAADRQVYPFHGNRFHDRGKILREAYNQYGTGITLHDGVQAADQTLRRDRDPGYAGTITLSVDPSETLSRWEITAGSTLRLQGFLGSSVRGVRFHIASVEKNPQDGTVSLTVDTRYRDALSLFEALERTRDPLTPQKMLQTNSNQVLIEDVQAPWSYAKGSGFVPLSGKDMYHHMPGTDAFPYQQWMLDHPPKRHPHWYVHVNASAVSSKYRWTRVPVQIRMSERGTIRRSEFVVVNRHGQLVATQFHVSLYYVNGISYRNMPTADGKVFSPFIQGAFESIDPATGQPWRTKPNLGGDTKNIIIGWGNYLQPAGYSPGLYSRGAKPTGMLVDESSWQFDCSTHNKEYNQLAKAGKEKLVAISVWAMFYADYDEHLFFTGRLFISPPGTTS